ncbi:MAG TPA: hypothetical protein ENJ29_13135 [Bacteroidetes bacterium]|nr:hypothetical protein [Bacteroidota bacterium]
MTSEYQERVLEEIRKMPEEHLPSLLQIIHLFRKSVTLKSAEESFEQGWKEVKQGETLPLSKLWEDVDAE